MPEQDREQSAAFVAYPDAPTSGAVARTRTPIVARPVQGVVDTDALIRRAMGRFPRVRAYLAR